MTALRASPRGMPVFQAGRLRSCNPPPLQQLWPAAAESPSLAEFARCSVFRQSIHAESVGLGGAPRARQECQERRVRAGRVSAQKRLWKATGLSPAIAWGRAAQRVRRARMGRRSRVTAGRS